MPGVPDAEVDAGRSTEKGSMTRQRQGYVQLLTRANTQCAELGPYCGRHGGRKLLLSWVVREAFRRRGRSKHRLLWGAKYKQQSHDVSTKSLEHISRAILAPGTFAAAAASHALVVQIEARR